jgi:hypothetical protein
MSTNHPFFDPLSLSARSYNHVFIHKSTPFVNLSTSLVIRLDCSHPTRVACPHYTLAEVQFGSPVIDYETNLNLVKKK